MAFDPVIPGCLLDHDYPDYGNDNIISVWHVFAMRIGCLLRVWFDDISNGDDGYNWN